MDARSSTQPIRFQKIAKTKNMIKRYLQNVLNIQYLYNIYIISILTINQKQPGVMKNVSYPGGEILISDQNLLELTCRPYFKLLLFILMTFRYNIPD